VIGFLPFLINTVDILLNPTAASITPDTDLVFRLLLGVFASLLTFAIAILCIRRAPGNLIGWLLIMFVYGDSIQVMRLGFFPLDWTIIIGNMMVGGFWFAFLFIPFYFPDGRLFPPRMNSWGNYLFSFCLFFSMAVTTLCNPNFTWGSVEQQLQVTNPFFLFSWDYRVITIPMIFILLIGGVVALILRYRGSGALERMQLRWLLFGTAFQLFFTILVTQLPDVPGYISNWAGALYGLIIPLSVGVAVLRYRLYDIDLIIRRTIQYGLITLLLGSIYYGMIIVLEQLFRSLTGQDSPLTIVISTLVIATLFNPIRKRIQLEIDRRFYRSRYDAEKALMLFSEAARNQVELVSLANRLAATTQESLQPEGVWVWLAKRGKMENGSDERDFKSSNTRFS
jgi:hypothetical protein